MKTLRKNNEFKRMSDTNMKEISAITKLLNDGWKYCPKQEYKNSFKTEKVKVDKTEKVDKVDKKSKGNKKS